MGLLMGLVIVGVTNRRLVPRYEAEILKLAQTFAKIGIYLAKVWSM